MRHQDRNRGSLQDGLGRATKHEFQQPRMAISTHDQEICADVRDVCEEHVGDVLLARQNLRGLSLDAMTREMRCRLGSVCRRMDMTLSIGELL